MITPNLCKAFRAFLGWNQDDLAKVAGLSSMTIKRFENGSHNTSKGNLALLEKTFNDHGISFKEDGKEVIMTFKLSETDLK